MTGWGVDTRNRRAARPLLLAAILSAAVAAWAPARADEPARNRLTLLEENDSLYFSSDKHYTQGLRLSYLGAPLDAASAWNDPTNLVAVGPFFAPGATDAPTARRYSVLFGQSIFTPRNLTLVPPDSRDRPYGGWLYLGASLMQETGRHMLENLELDFGVVGPGAFGKQVQNDWHQLINVKQAQGWSSQIQNEPGLMLSYERLWHVPVIGDGDSVGVDLVPQVGATVGNVFTYGEVGGLVRIGRNLRADYGPARIRPALSGTDYFNLESGDGRLGYYVFAGAQGRVVGHNLFLDGNSFRSSPSVGRKTLVADLQAGVSVFWSTAFRLDLSVVRRTEEFTGQSGPDEIGTAALSFSW